MTLILRSEILGPYLGLRWRDLRAVSLFRRVREVAHHGARFLLVDLWTNAAHTDPLFAVLMAGAFLMVGGNGDVYSVEEARSWLEQAGWHFLEHKPLAGPASLVVAEVAA